MEVKITTEMLASRMVANYVKMVRQVYETLEMMVDEKEKGGEE